MSKPEAAKLADRLQLFVDASDWWDNCEYGTRIYFGNRSADEYIHRSEFRAIIAALRTPSGARDVGKGESFEHWFDREYPLYDRDGRDTSLRHRLRHAWNAARTASESAREEG